jgi:O-antigen/teichoic acid export membrane protein
MHKKALKSSFALIGINYFVYAINIVVQLFLVRLLLPEDFGTFVIIISIAEILAIFLTLDLSNSCIYYQKKDNIFHTSVFISITIFIIAIVLLVISKFILDGFIEPEILNLAIIIILFKLIVNNSMIYASYLEKDFLFIRLNIYKAVARIFALATGLTMAYMSYSYYSLIAIEIVNSILVIGVHYIISPFKFDRYKYDKSIVDSILNYSFKMYFNRMTEVLLYRIPNLIIDKLTGNKQLIGFTDRSFYLSGLPSTVSAPFHTKVAFVLFGKIREDKNNIAITLEWTLWIFSRVVVPFSVILYLYPKELIGLFFGENWLMMSEFIKALSIYSFVFLLFNIIKQIFFSLNLTKYIIYIQWSFIIIILITILTIVQLDYEWSNLMYIYSFTYILAIVIMLYILYSKEIILNYIKIFLFPLLYFITCVLFELNFIMILISYFILLSMIDFKNIKSIYLLVREHKTHE